MIGPALLRREEIRPATAAGADRLGVLGVVLGIGGRKPLSYLLSDREERQSGAEGGVLAGGGEVAGLLPILTR